ncbi:hypothetical protein [Xanthomarina sp. F2636L]|uniref:hypothetical protein n=1 Tax=Xanthomarina sp. F2636L TaxID=2996018 RepID=UPI00225DF3FA|nr:hypothetical protein [Xanthomarina sp. F2636L]MCX7551239.1 hypothetical protein [Xanthomarina sp. F2636L]
MNTKVVPFNPFIKNKQNANKVAQEMEQLINEQAVDGWKFYNFYTTETLIAGSNGCFGIGAKPDVLINLGFLVFTK